MRVDESSLTIYEMTPKEERDWKSSKSIRTPYFLFLLFPSNQTEGLGFWEPNFPQVFKTPLQYYTTKTRVEVLMQCRGQERNTFN